MPLFTWSTLAQGFFSGRLTRENFGEIKEDLSESCVLAYCYEQNFQRLDRAFELARTKNKTVPQIALAYILSHPLNTFTLMDCATGDEFKANLEALDSPLTAEKRDWLDLRRKTH